MWFVLESSLQSIDFQSDVKSRCLISNLLHSVALGQHAIAASGETARHLMRYDFGIRENAVIAAAYSRAYELLGCAKESPFSIVVSAEIISAEKSRRGWRVPISWFEAGVPRSCVLGENQRDADLYIWAAKQHIARNRTGFGIDAATANGGGSNTPDALEGEYRNRGRIVLCITDSDKHWPACPGNSTSEKCSAIAEKYDGVTKHIAIEEHEIENVVPINLLSDSLGSDQAELVAKVLELRSIPGIFSVWKYLDLKKGTKASKTSRSARRECRDYWRRFDHYAFFAANAKARCAGLTDCAEKKDSDCRCFVTPPLGEQVCNLVLRHLERNSPKATDNRVRTSENRETWEQIGEAVYNWCVASERRRM